MARSGDIYQRQLMALLPPGLIWSRDPDSVIGRIVGAMGDGLARVDLRAAQLLDEAFTDTTFELLPDWERNFGLPDTCSGDPGSIFGRRLALTQKVVSRGGQTPAYYVSIAESLGLGADIEEQTPWTCESACEDSLTGDLDRFVWIMNVYLPEDTGSVSASVFTCESSCEDPLDAYGMVSLECLIRRAAPAHTTVQFAYPTAPDPVFEFDFRL